ncbi:MAG: LysR family transcriptional regulator [Granulosicoccus sp.]
MQALQPQQISLRKLRYLAYVGETGSVMNTAIRLDRDPSSVSKALAGLETQLNITLFTHSNQVRSLTAAGEILAARAKNAALILSEPILQKSGRRSRKPASTRLMSLSNNKLLMILALVQHTRQSDIGRSTGLGVAGVAKSLRETEQQLGMSLVERQGKAGVIALPETLKLANQIRLAFSEVHYALDELQSLHGVKRGTVTIGSSPFVRTSLLPRCIAAFRKEFPQVTVRTEEAPPAELSEKLANGSLDFIVGPLLARVDNPALECISLMRAPIGLAVDSKHALASKKRITKQHLESLEWVVPPEGSPSRVVFESLMKKHKVNIAPHRVETSSFAIRRGLLLETDHAAVSPVAEFENDILQGHIKLLRPAFFSSSDWASFNNNSSVLKRKNARYPQHVQSFLNITLSIASSFNDKLPLRN